MLLLRRGGRLAATGLGRRGLGIGRLALAVLAEGGLALAMTLALPRALAGGRLPGRMAAARRATIGAGASRTAMTGRIGGLHRAGITLVTPTAQPGSAV
jgi:hypothetical protein